MIKTIKAKVNLKPTETTYYYNFELNAHIETNNELKKDYSEVSLENKNLKKASFKFVYNYFLKEYEKYFSVFNSNIDELDMINYYNFVDYYQKSPVKIDLENLLNNFNPKVLPEKLFIRQEKVFFKDNSEKNSQFYSYEPKKTSIFKQHFPFYMKINFDNLKDEENFHFTELLETYDLKSRLLEKFSITPSSKGVILLDNNFFITEMNFFDVGFFTKLEGLKDKKRINSLEEKTYYEVIGYNISKYLVDSNNLSSRGAITEWYVPCLNEKELEIIDTQIFYDKKYYYKISPIVIAAVVQAKASSDGTATLENTEFAIMQIGSTAYTGRLLTPPPFSPGVFFSNIDTESKKIKILFNEGIGEIKKEPVPIDSTDNLEIAKYRNTDFFENNKLHYSSGLDIKKYEIYRLEKPPIQYSDFSEGVRFETLEGATVFEDKIQENKKYYYLFRAIDVHDGISDISEVFVLEIYGDSGVYYSNLNIFEVKKIDEFREPSRNFRKFFSFYPQLWHTSPNNEKNDEILDAKVFDKNKLSTLIPGYATPSIWSKQFKIRITSLSTGKKIDLNIDFKKDIKQ